MIQIFKKENTDYSHNGDMVLLPTLCELDATLNGAWILTLEHPLDDLGRWKYIAEDAIIQCKSFLPNLQRFRIYEVERGSEGVQAHARPIFQDTKDTLLLDTRPTDKTGQEALDIILSGTGFSGSSDITARATAYYIRKNISDALLGSDENAFVSRWGGEVIYDNEAVIINGQAGGDYGVSCEFGKNLEEIEETTNLDDVITRIVPVSFNGYTLDGDTPWVDSPNIGKYATIHMREVQFRNIALAEDKDGGYETLEELQEALREASARMYSEQKVDEPTINYTVNMINLASTTEYSEYAILETVGLGDTIKCRHKNLGIDVSARVIRLVYDCIRGVNSEVELGNYRNDYFSRMQDLAGRVQQTITPMGEVRADTIQGVIDCMKAQLRAQKSIAQPQQVRAMLFEDLDPGSETYGAMCIGTMGFQIASQRTEDGRDWDWKTFGTAQGFRAEYIIAGILQGVEIIAEQGRIAGWNINSKAIYKDIATDNGIIYRVYFQPPLESTPDKTWVLSCQKSADGGKTFTGNFILYSDGSAKFGSTKISADGSILNESDIGYVSIYDGNIMWGAKENGTYKLAGRIVTSRGSDGSVSSVLDADNVLWSNVNGRTPYTGSLIVKLSDDSIKSLLFEKGVLMSTS